MTPPLKALGGYSNASSRPSDGFVLLIPTDRADSLYQRLNLSLAVLFLGRRFSVTDLLGFEVAASFFFFEQRSLLPIVDPIFAFTYDYLVSAAKQIFAVLQRNFSAPRARRAARYRMLADGATFPTQPA